MSGKSRTQSERYEMRIKCDALARKYRDQDNGRQFEPYKRPAEPQAAPEEPAEPASKPGAALKPLRTLRPRR
jgi:hypothetical protein